LKEKKYTYTYKIFKKKTNRAEAYCLPVLARCI
jgi:hypothetical protein